MYLQNKYTKCYEFIINNARNRIHDPSEYYETHHILPRCMGGSNERSNLIKLTAREHFICHILLVKMVNDTVIRSKLSYAAWQMTMIKNRPRYIPTSKQYEFLRKQLSKNTKGIPKTEEHKLAMRKPKSNTEHMKGGKGRTPGFTQSEEAKLKLSLKMKGRLVGEKNPFYGKTHSEENRKKWSEMFKGVPLSLEHKRNIGNGLKGKPTWNKGIPMSEIAKQKAGISLAGRITVNNGLKNKRVRPEEVDSFIVQGWVKGKLI